MTGNMAVFLLFLLPSFLVLLPGCSSKICAPPNYDIKPLLAVKQWWFELDNITGCNPVNTTASTCAVFFSVCRAVPVICPSNSGICLTNKLTLGKEFNNATFYAWPKNLGVADGYSFDAGRNNFRLTFPNQIEATSVGPSTEITFKCNKNVTWTPGTVDFKPVKVPELPSINYIEADSKYIITFNASFACEKGGGGGGGGGSDEPPHPLSVGSILLILFFPSVFLYFVIGVLINRGAGKTGKEMIPQSKFWMDLPALIVDGFSFCCAKITCNQMSTSREPYDRM